MGDAYPELRAGRNGILRAVRSEEDRFDAVLTAGLPRLEDVLDRAAAGTRVVPGEEAFRLYDSLGVPLDFIEDLAGQRQLTLDREGFDRAMAGQRDRARAGSTFKGGTKDVSWAADAGVDRELQQTKEEFVGYDSTRVQGLPVLAIFNGTGQQVDSLGAQERGYVAISRTPFYVEAGGQVSDVGVISSPAAEAQVLGVVRSPNWPRLHLVEVSSGTLRPRDVVTAAVAEDVRDATRRNHTATHLLHAALRHVLGSHVKQAGSLVAPDRLRFDFAHFSPVSREHLEEIERLVNRHIVGNLTVQTDIRSTEEAIASGAMALFGEKYGDRVRVVSVPGVSVELCGGTHVRATGDIGFFVITEESGVAAGVRRIEALTGEGALTWAQRQRGSFRAVLETLNSTPDQAAEVLQRLQLEGRRLAREVDQLKMKLALSGGGSRQTGGADEAPQDVSGVKLIARRVEGLERTALRGLSDSLRDRLGSGVIVIASDHEGKVSLVVSVTKDLTGRIQAGRLVKDLAPIVGGGGGGRPDFAEAGGKDPSRIPELIATAPRVLASHLQN
jgi:alanyl-tRNA synthetase